MGNSFSQPLTSRWITTPSTMIPSSAKEEQQPLSHLEILPEPMLFQPNLQQARLAHQPQHNPLGIPPRWRQDLSTHSCPSTSTSQLGRKRKHLHPSPPLEAIGPAPTYCQTLQDLHAYPRPRPLPQSLFKLRQFHQQSQQILQPTLSSPMPAWLQANYLVQQRRHWELINWAHRHPGRIQALDDWLQFAYQQHIGKKDLYHHEQIANMYRTFFELHCAVYLAQQSSARRTIVLDGDAQQYRQHLQRRQPSFDFSLCEQHNNHLQICQFWEITSIGKPLRHVHQLRRPLQHVLRKSLTLDPEQACALAIAIYPYQWHVTHKLCQQMLTLLNSFRPLRVQTVLQRPEHINYWQWGSSRLDRILLFDIHQPQLAPIADLQRCATGQWLDHKRPHAPCAQEGSSL